MVEYDSAHKIIHHPYVTEKTMMEMEEENKLEFICDLKANKHQIADAAEELFDVKVEKVNTRIDGNGKRAVIKFTDEYSAEEIGMRIGVF
ncbi:MAG: 50S ribosomal protein L23 [Candidatus Thermoplasmatota archaeon]|nr:50S ribosomal protein L23 [Candidatus Thermoplasmatota archaeon]